MLPQKVSAVDPESLGKQSRSESRERIEQRKFDDPADRVCRDDRAQAENIVGKLSTESVHETGAGGSIK